MDPSQVASMFSWPGAEETKATWAESYEYTSTNPSQQSQEPSIDKCVSSSPWDREGIKGNPANPSKPESLAKSSKPQSIANSYMDEIKQKLILVSKFRSGSKATDSASQCAALKKQLDSLWLLAKCPGCLSISRTHAFECGHFVCEGCAGEICPVCETKSVCYKVND